MFEGAAASALGSGGSALAGTALAGTPAGAALMASMALPAFSPFGGAPSSNDAKSTGFATMNSDFVVGGSAIQSADPVSRSLNNLVPVLIAGVIAWVVLRKR